MSGLTAADLHWLDAAVAQAEPRLGTTAENPTVGAIIVDPVTGGEISRAVTAPGGRPHAETQAIAAAGERARGATIYVTLEPCNHFGRTPPCVNAILAAGLGRVVIGVVDPDPRTAGGGLERLAQGGVEIVVADHAPSRRLHEGHIARQTLQRPYVIAKLAISADGMIGRRGEPNVPITGGEAREFAQRVRATSDAIMVGGATANADDPRLTVRLGGFEDRHPLRVILAGSEALRPDLTLLAKDAVQRTAVIGVNGGSSPAGTVTFCQVIAGEGGRPDLPAALHALYEHDIGRLLVEGGAKLTAALLEKRLVDRFLLFTSPVVVGAGGVPASVGMPIEERIAAAGLAPVDRQTLGVDNVATFERTT